jgi:hypothetical protein
VGGGAFQGGVVRVGEGVAPGGYVAGTDPFRGGFEGLGVDVGVLGVCKYSADLEVQRMVEMRLIGVGEYMYLLSHRYTSKPISEKYQSAPHSLGAPQTSPEKQARTPSGAAARRRRPTGNTPSRRAPPRRSDPATFP